MEPDLDQKRRRGHALLDALSLAQVEEEDLTPDTTAALDRALLHSPVAWASLTKKSSANSA